VILDLDETLIHSTEQEIDKKYDFQFDSYFVYKRPGLHQFINQLGEIYDIGVWSSASDDYVKIICNHIFKDEIKPKFIYGRSKCTARRDLETDTYVYEKRIDKLKSLGYDKNKIIIIDDSREKLRTNYGNAIYIKEFTGNSNDNELEKLYQYLITLKDVENVRNIEKRNWRYRTIT